MKKVSLVMNLIMCLMMSAVFSIFGQLVGTGKMDWSLFPMTFLISFVLSFMLLQFVPIMRWGNALADKLHAKGFFNGAIVTAVMVIIMVPIIMTAMSIYIVHFLFGAPIIAAVMSNLPNLPLLILIAWIFGMIASKPCLMLAMKLCKAAPEQTK